MVSASTITTWLGTVASVMGVLIAVAQTVRLPDLRRGTEADLWQIIGTTQRLLRELGHGKGGEDAALVAREVLRHLIKNAALAERPFTERTIERWKCDGKIGTDFEIAQARRFLPTSRKATGTHWLTAEQIEERTRVSR